MSQRFAGLKASNYVFRDQAGDRNVIVLFAGARQLAFIEYDTVDKLIARLQALKALHGAAPESPVHPVSLSQIGDTVHDHHAAESGHTIPRPHLA